MTPPFEVASFEGYQSAVLAALAPRVADDVRGIEVRLNVRRRHIDVVVFRVDGESLVATQRTELYQAVAPLAAQFPDFVDYTTRVAFETCAKAAALIYRGVPVWERAGTRWQLTAEPRELGLLVQAS